MRYSKVSTIALLDVVSDSSMNFFPSHLPSNTTRMLCSACNDIPLKLYALLENPALSWRNLYPYPTFPHSKKLSALRKTQDDGCTLCELLFRCARNQLGEEQVGDLDSRDESLSYQIDRYTADDEAACMCITGLTFYFGWNDDPRAMVNFSASFFVELVSSVSTAAKITAFS